MDCKRLNNILKKRFDIDLLVEPLDRDHLESVYEHYRDQRLLLRSSLMESSEYYTKAYLISEAARIILREIAPKRRKKRRENND